MILFKVLFLPFYALHYYISIVLELLVMWCAYGWWWFLYVSFSGLQTMLVSAMTALLPLLDPLSERVLGYLSSICRLLYLALKAFLDGIRKDVRNALRHIAWAPGLDARVRLRRDRRRVRGNIRFRRVPKNRRRLRRLTM